MTLEELQAFPNGEVFATGVLPNSPEGLYITSSNIDEPLRWIAKKGYAPGCDWAVYCHWAYHDVEWIKERGDKVTTDSNIQKCVPCDQECLNIYRK